MKNSIFNASILFSSIILLVTSCKKENIEPLPLDQNNTTSVTTNEINDFFKQNVLNATQNFSLSANSSQRITGTKGTQLYFPANNFKDHLGNTVSGNIDIELIEIQTKADMIWLNKTTTSNEKLLVSGGELSVKAFQNGAQLTMATNGYINVSLPTNNPTNMILFSGNEDINGDLNWDSTSTNVSVDSSGNFNFNIYSGTLGSDSLGWINCDYFYSQSNLTTLEVIPPTNHNGLNTIIYFFFNNIYSVAPAYWGTQSFKSYNNSLPIGSQITIVAISEINGQLYSSFTPITLISNHSESITLSPTTSTTLQNDLNNL